MILIASIGVFLLNKHRTLLTRTLLPTASFYSKNGSLTDLKDRVFLASNEATVGPNKVRLPGFVVKVGPAWEVPADTESILQSALAKKSAK